MITLPSRLGVSLDLPVWKTMNDPIDPDTAPKVPPLLQWVSLAGSLASITGISAIWLFDEFDLNALFDWSILLFFTAWMIGWACLVVWALLAGYRALVAEQAGLLRWGYILIGTPLGGLILVGIGTLTTSLIKGVV